MIEWKGLTSSNWNSTTVMASFVVAIFLALFLSRVNGMRVTFPTKMSMASLPSNVVKYSQVPSGSRKSFTRNTIPKGLLRRHNTKEGTWGVINLSSGRLQYTVDEGPHKGIYKLDINTKGIIEPQVYHSVAPVGEEEVEFVVEFYRLPNTGPVDEKREGL